MISKNVYLYCKDDISLIENYEKAFNDKYQSWHCHHRLETELNLTPKELIKMEMYFNRPASELIFLTKSDHRKIHNNKLTDNTKKKISDSNKGKTAWNKGIPRTEEQKRNQSLKMKGRKGKSPRDVMSPEKYDSWRNNISKTHKGKKLSDEHKSSISNGLIGRKQSDEQKQKVSMFMKNWWTQKRAEKSALK